MAKTFPLTIQLLLSGPRRAPRPAPATASAHPPSQCPAPAPAPAPAQPRPAPTPPRPAPAPPWPPPPAPAPAQARPDPPRHGQCPPRASAHALPQERRVICARRRRSNNQQEPSNYKRAGERRRVRVRPGEAQKKTRKFNTEIKRRQLLTFRFSLAQRCGGRRLLRLPFIFPLPFRLIVPRGLV